MLDQKLLQKQQQKLSPQQIQVIKMLEIPTVELDTRIKEEIEANPALEVDDTDEPDDNQEKLDSNESDSDSDSDNGNDDDFSGNDDDGSPSETDKNDEFDIDDYFNEDEYSNYKYSVNNTSPDQENKDIPFSGGNSFQENLKSQLGLLNLSEDDMAIADFIIGNIDEDGYLRRDLESISDDILLLQNKSVSVEDLQRILSAIQTLDPAGIGATSLQECLLLQLERKRRTPETVTAKAILANYYEEFTKKHFLKIQQGLEIEEDDLKAAMDVILKLNPKPGNGTSDSYAKTINQTIIPDFVLENQNGEMVISINSRNAPNLKVSKTYVNMLQDYKPTPSSNKQDREAFDFIKQKLDSAKWFIDALKQRNVTLLSTMQVIFDFQKEFFTTGDETKLKPMILKDIADRTGLDISTISRVANSKHIQTPYGVYPLKYFFSEGLQTESGEEASSRQIKQILQDTINEEDKKKPYTDEQLAEVLKTKGYIIARRTIAKYREQLGLPVGRLRKEL
ncbi:MAG: RNA polymerase factor sigma-54 [Bacteroidales bacterium]|nr:RNA polymerase factor sigma-54 [Bacteroidales bacterium]